MTGIRLHTIYSIVAKNSWRNLVKDIDFPVSNMSSRKNVKLNTKDVKDIIDLLLNNKTNNEIAEIYNVEPKTISDIRNHKTWKELTKDYDFIRSPRSSDTNLTELQKKIINAKYIDKLKNCEISRLLNVGASTVSAAIRRYENLIKRRNTECQL